MQTSHPLKILESTSLLSQYRIFKIEDRIFFDGGLGIHGVIILKDGEEVHQFYLSIYRSIYITIYI